ncbi:hypothetical protein SAMN04487934_11360 [Eubacterium ruminantium]|nr:hypothetical protein SAMN04487934_11360 [Eubacterium ruminantium]
MPFLTKNELSNIVSYHTSVLSEDERSWFESECRKLEEETKYKLEHRASGDNAFRMYLMAEKNMSIDDVVELEKLPKETVLGYMREFFDFYNKPGLTTADKVELFGKVNITAMDKILEYTIPNPGRITGMEDLASLQKKLYIMGIMYIDVSQDTQEYTNPKTNEKELREAYYKGTGGSQNLQQHESKWTVFSKAFYNMYSYLWDDQVTLPGKCAILDSIKEFFGKYAGKKIKTLPQRLTSDLLSIAASNADYGREFLEDYMGSNEAFVNYLNGLSTTYPGKDIIKEQTRIVLTDNRSNDNIGFKDKLRNLVCISMDAGIAGLLTEEEKEMQDLTLLPEETKQKMIKIYRESFGTYYKDITLLNIESKNLTEFDVIKNGSGVSITKLAGSKYAKYDKMTQDNALMLETIRAMAVEKNGLKLQYVETQPDGKLTLSKPIGFKKVADSINIHLSRKFDAAAAEMYFEHPDNTSMVFKASTNIKPNIEGILSNQREIMDKYHLDIYDCVYVGDKTLRQLFYERNPKDAPIRETETFSFVAAASHRNEPVFVTTLSEESGNLKRNVVPITFRGQLVTHEQSKTDVVKQTRRDAKAIIDRENATLANSMLTHTDPFLGRKTVDPEYKPFDKKYLEEQDGAKIAREVFTEIRTNFLNDHPEFDNRINPVNDGEGDFGTDLNTYMSDIEYKSGLVERKGRIPDLAYSIPKIYEKSLNPGDNRKLKKLIKEIRDGFKKEVNALPDNEKVYKPLYQLVLHRLDTENVSMIKMMDDNPLTNALLVMNNHGPAIFRPTQINTYMSKDTITQRLTERGLFMPIISIYCGADDIISAEYQKQRDEKSGWSNEKEQRYFFRLKKGYENVIKNYEEMEKWPLKDQLLKGKDFEDNLGSFTNLSTGSAARGLGEVAYMMKWEIQGMKNGWHADNIHVLGGMGSIEGIVKKNISRYKHLIEDCKENLQGMEEGAEKTNLEGDLRKYEENLEALKEFEETKLAGFKKSILGKKIKSPRDILDALNKFEAFMEENKDVKVVKDFGIFDNALQFKSYVDEVSNNAIEDVKTMMVNPKSIEKKYKATVIPEYKGAKPEDMIREMRAEKNIPAAAAEAYIQKYVKELYLSKLYKPDNPKLFNEKKSEHKWEMNKLETQAKHYAAEFIEKLAGGKEQAKNYSISGEELADLMQYGHHEVYFREFDNEMRFQKAKDGFDLLVNRKLKTPDGRQVSMVDAMKEGLKDLENSYVLLGGSRVYDEVQVELDNIIKIKTKLDAKLKKQFDDKKDCRLDQKEYEQLHKRVSTLCGVMHSYIVKKDKIKKQKGSLGKNGEKRYNAMKKSMNAVYCFEQALERYGNLGPLESDFAYQAIGAKDSKASYAVRPEAVKSFIDKQKEFGAKEIAELNRQAEDALAAEESKRTQALDKGVNGQIEIIRSIDKTLYLTTIKKAYGNGSDSLLKTEDIIKDYNAKLTDLKCYKDKSKNLKQFMDDYINNTGFKDIFLAEVTESAELGKVSNADILNCRDKALTTMLNNAKGSHEIMEKIDMVARMTGSPVNSEILGFKAPAAPNAPVQHKAPVHQNEAANNYKIGK